MIVPNKYTDFNMSIINIAAEIIKIMKENGPLKYDVALKMVQNSAGEESKYVFQSALNFLFLLGKIKYSCKEDILELIL